MEVCTTHIKYPSQVCSAGFWSWDSRSRFFQPSFPLFFPTSLPWRSTLASPITRGAQLSSLMTPSPPRTPMATLESMAKVEVCVTYGIHIYTTVQCGEDDVLDASAALLFPPFPVSFPFLPPLASYSSGETGVRASDP